MCIRDRTSSANKAAADGLDAAAAMVHGIDVSFMVTLVIILLLFIFSFFFVHDYEQIAAIHQKKPQQAKGR